MKKVYLPLVLASVILSLSNSALAERDWEYWSQGCLSIPLKEKVNILILPEWRFKNDMRHLYLFKLENGINFKINEYLDITPYYVYQEKKSSGNWDKSDLTYLDATVRLSFKNFFDLKFSNRFRYQYDFDKGKTTLRNSVKVSKTIKIGKVEIMSYVSEEPFYDSKLDMFTEHRTAVGVGYNLSKDISISTGYMLDSKKGSNKWNYTNVLLSNLNIRF
jgi:hypothetical protein